MKMLKSHILKVLEKYPAIKLCLLFGSAAKGRSRAESDVDIAVGADRVLSSEEKLALMGELTVATGRAADMIDLQSAGGPVLQQVLTTGEIVLKTDKRLYAEILKKMLFYQSDMMPLYTMILKKRRERFLHG